jgi:hypothetical protein
MIDMQFPVYQAHPGRAYQAANGHPSFFNLSIFWYNRGAMRYELTNNSFLYIGVRGFFCGVPCRIGPVARR